MAAIHQWTDLLKHDKLLSKKAPAPHLRDVPEYLLDPTTQEASKIVKLARAAMGNTNSTRRKGFNKGKFKKSRDPLKTFSAEVKYFPTRVILYPVSILALIWFLLFVMWPIFKLD